MLGTVYLIDHMYSQSIILHFRRMNNEYLKWRQLGQHRDREAWAMVPSEVNAYFNPSANEVLFLLLGLPRSSIWLDRLPCRHPTTPLLLKKMVLSLRICFLVTILILPRPGYLKYGSFGSVAAHELTVSILCPVQCNIHRFHHPTACI